MQPAFDVAVIGLGAMGSATLWRLAARGARVVGVDRFDPPHDRGSSHGESRIIRTAYFEDPAYLPLLREAFPLWRSLEQESGAELLTMTGAAMIGRMGSEVIKGAQRTATVYGLPHRMFQGAEAARRFPQHRLRRDDVVFHEEQGGVLRPELSVAAALRAARDRGAQVMTGTVVHAVEPVDGGVRISVDGDIVVARSAVICAGAWTGRLVPELAPHLSVERQVNAWFPVHDAGEFAAEGFAVFIREMNEDHYVYGVPAPDGTVKLAVHHEGAPVDPDTVSRQVGEDDLAPLREHAGDWMLAMDPDPVRSIVCVYTNTPDEHFVVDTLPGAPQVTVVSACSGHGFKFAPVIGDIAADLALQRSTARDISRFSLQRLG
ncbi:MAG TPA: N-methyl-L-tryptophan oxidase [Candidatus Dormibacteraeota bacterium]|jgi:sarcosine oxidase|nr:N-methyl-L-tryptophan oxidase [Candidatus Dormibacteraeota bacterium]